jgi:ribonuclease HII
MGSIIGVDEAGRGPVIGPLIVAGFKLDFEEQVKILEKLKVRDSKKCTPIRRERLAVELKKIGHSAIKSCSASEIDKIRKNKTLNKLEGELFGKVINSLSPNNESTIFVDSADANEETFKKYIESELKTEAKIISKHKADEIYLIVSAASILAKTTRDARVREIELELNAEIGSGYPADPITRKFLEKWIKDKGDLPPYTRRSWNTAIKMMRNMKTPVKTLDDFID